MSWSISREMPSNRLRELSSYELSFSGALA
jgi:hypothetical protein